MHMNPSLSTTELTEILHVSPQRISTLATSLNLKESTVLKGNQRFYNADAVKKIFSHRGYTHKRKVITFSTLKGGTGKTTVSLGTAIRLSCFGGKVLFIDLDKQANASVTVMGKAGEKVLVDIVTGNCTAEECIVPINPYFHLLPSSLLNSRLEVEISNRKLNHKTYYAKLLKGVIDKYDYIIIDTPPDLSHSVFLAMLFSNILVVPVNLDQYSLDGLSLTLDTIKELKENYPDADLNVNVVINKYDAREKTGLKYLAELNSLEGIDLMPDVVRVDRYFKNHHRADENFFLNVKSSNAVKDISNFARNLCDLNF